MKKDNKKKNVRTSFRGFRTIGDRNASSTLQNSHNVDGTGQNFSIADRTEPVKQ
jgi:hypothetical protein